MDAVQREGDSVLRAVVVGATGVVGQQFILALNQHPWFRLVSLAASERSAGKSYRQALQDEKTGAMRWYDETPPPEEVLDLPVQQASRLDLSGVDVVFTALDAEPARELEPLYAALRPVISTASTFRYEGDVPILVPGVNSQHAGLVHRQQQEREWKGFVVPIPNCTTTGLVTTLKPIAETFGLQQVFMTSMQALSGAGRDSGVLALDIIDNLIPFIPGEEEKVQLETQKILGSFSDGRISPLSLPVSCTCTRVNVKEGHTEAVFAATERPCTVEEVKEAMTSFASQLADQGLPSAPRETIVVLDDPYRPQPRMDRNTYDGMAVVVGRLRQDPALENGIKYVLVSHNTKLGAAKGAVLVAELLVKEGLIQ